MIQTSGWEREQGTAKEVVIAGKILSSDYESHSNAEWSVNLSLRRFESGNLKKRTLIV